MFGCGSSLISGNENLDGKSNPMFRTLLMFIGEILCSLFILCSTSNQTVTSNQNCQVRELMISSSKCSSKEDIPITDTEKLVKRLGNLCYCIISAVDFLNTILVYICSNYLDTAYLVSLKMLTLVFVLMYKWVKVNESTYPHEKIGLCIYLLGMTIIIVKLICSNADKFSMEKLLCIFMLIVAGFFEAIMLVSINFSINKLKTSPSQVVSIQGFVGIILVVGLYIPINSLISIYFPQASTETILTNLRDNPAFLSCCLLLIADLAFYNLFMVKMLKMTDPINFCAINSTRVIIIWLILLCISPNDFESTILIDVSGGLFITLGALVYSGLIILPFKKMKKSVDKKMRQSPMYVSPEKPFHLF